MLTLYILTDGKNYVMDDPIHPGRVMYSTSPVVQKILLHQTQKKIFALGRYIVGIKNGQVKE